MILGHLRSFSGKKRSVSVISSHFKPSVHHFHNTHKNYLFHFGTNVEAFALAGTTENFLENPEKFYNQGKQVWENRQNHVANYQFARNHMMFDLGYSAELEVDSEIEAVISEVQSEYDLVMLVEYMAESVLLLKEVMCWEDMKDIVYLKSNSRKDEKVGLKNGFDEVKNMVYPYMVVFGN